MIDSDMTHRILAALGALACSLFSAPSQTPQPQTAALADVERRAGEDDGGTDSEER
jgi:hypothetical protein